MKRIKFEEIPDIIGPKAKVGIGNGCAEPQTLVEALIEFRERFRHLDIYGMILFSSKHLLEPHPGVTFKLNSFMIDRFTVEGIKKGYVEYIPCRYSQIPSLFLDGILPLDVALISVSKPNTRGICSFGVSSDFTMAMARSAKTVIAEINDRMPWVFGKGFIKISEIDYYLETDRPLPQWPAEEQKDIDLKIGENVAGLIDDGATIQIGIGRLSEGVLSFLHHKKNLGIHSGLITDGIVDLLQKGAADNSRKGLKNGRTIGTTLIGTDKLFQFVHGNKTVETYPSDYTHNQVVLAKLNRLHSINGALEVDLMGQVNAETIDGLQVSGVGGQTDFICGAALSKGGKAIIVIQSTSNKEDRSKIVPGLEKGAAVTSLRHDIDYVVTEYGIACLRGKTLRERAQALVAIAHPKFRDWLESQGRRLLH
ncbi:MAG: acetyl-CoA hydrolase/transferase C-terminal domain-containing protein [Thermodesulfobacteriota bacterium]